MPPIRQEQAEWAVGAILRGSVAGLLVALILLCVLALVSLWVDLDDRVVRLIIDVIAAFGALVAGFLAGQRAEWRGFAHGLLAGLFFAVLVSVIGLVFFQGDFAALAWLVRFGVGALLGAVGGIFGVNFS